MDSRAETAGKSRLNGESFLKSLRKLYASDPRDEATLAADVLARAERAGVGR
jgi:hypothetical protein